MYDFETEKARLFSDNERIKCFLAIRDNVRALIAERQVFTAAEAWDTKKPATDSWHLIGCLDFLCELGEIRPIATGTGRWAQHAIYERVK